MWGQAIITPLPPDYNVYSVRKGLQSCGDRLQYSWDRLQYLGDVYILAGPTSDDHRLRKVRSAGQIVGHLYQSSWTERRYTASSVHVGQTNVWSLVFSRGYQTNWVYLGIVEYHRTRVLWHHLDLDVYQNNRGMRFPSPICRHLTHVWSYQSPHSSHVLLIPHIVGGSRFSELRRRIPTIIFKTTLSVW